MSKIDRHFMRQVIKPATQEDGGEGSGNHNHAGRPGKVGGSAPNKGASTGTGTAKLPAKRLTKEHIEAQRVASGTPETYEEYSARMQEVMAPQATPKPQNVPVTGKDLGRRYYFNPRKSLYKYEIDDVIHTQGFDGVPKVVSRAEFDKFVKDNPNALVLMRSYSAPTPETLKGYDESLESGTWYVNCSHARADYGQGMYCNGFLAKDASSKMPGALESMKKVREKREAQCESSLGHYFGSIYSDSENDSGTFQQHLNPDYPQRYGADGEPQKVDFDKIKEGEYYVVTKKTDDVYGVFNESLLVTRKNGQIEWVSKKSEGGGYSQAIDPEAWMRDNKDVISRQMQRLKVLPDAKPVSSTRIMVMMPDAKIINLNELWQLKGRRFDEDIGVFAARLGYDAIMVPDHDYAVVLNRTKVILCDEQVDVYGGAA